LRPLARFQAPSADPFATLVSTKSTGNVSGNARSTTGYIKVEWWDNTSNVYGTGVALSGINWSKAAGGAGSKTLRIYPSDASGNLSGSLNTLDCFSNFLTSLDVSGLTALTAMNCSDNSLTSLDASGLTALNALACNNNSLTSLDVSGLTALNTLTCNGNFLTSLDVSGLTALETLTCNGNSLTSLRAVGVPGMPGYGSGASYASPYYGGVMAANNSLDATALDQLYTDLKDNTVAGGYALVFVGGNPGTTGDDPTIATAKQWIVLGS
jgi:hypothetical protein